MKIFMTCPAPAGSRKGNRVTAVRWARILRALGHRVRIAGAWDGQPCDLLIALHARKSHSSIKAYRQAFPDGPLIVALTGTDLYRDLKRSPLTRQSLEMADRLVVLQTQAIADLPRQVRAKATVVWQSTVPVGSAKPRRVSTLKVCVLGHLRHEKDPFRTAQALRLLPQDFPVRVLHAGQAMSPVMEKQARAAMRRDPRYRWLGEISRGKARRLLSRSDVMVISSRMEGGANVVSEAIVEGVPVLASRVAGNIGMLGKDYPGYFKLGDSAKLAALLRRVWEDDAFYEQLTAWIKGLRGRFSPSVEKGLWRELLGMATKAERGSAR